MARVIDIYNFIDSFAPFNTAMDFDNVGVLIGDKNKEIKNAVLALDASNDVINYAKSIKAELIITHHPVIFNPLKSIASDSIPYKAVSNNISIISAHTNLDLSNEFGVNTCLAQKLELKNCFFPRNDMPIIIGEYENETDCIGFLQKAKNNLNAPIRYTKINKPIKKVAVGGGSCGDLMYIAIENGADAFVTGEIKHHEYIFAYDNGLLAVDATHYATEKLVMPCLSEKLAERFPEINFIVSDGDRLYE